MTAPGVREETTVQLRYKVNGSAVMTEPTLVRAVSSPLESMVRDSSATVVSAAMRIPFVRSSRIRRFPWRCCAQPGVQALKCACRAGSEARTEHDIRQRLADWAGVDLTRINGLGVTVVMKLLTEIGPDVSRFASVKHFCSWPGLCPGTKISGAKVLSAGTRRSASRARQALEMAAQSLCRSESALGAFHRRLCGRMDKPKANAATAHKLARMVYFMLTRGEAFVDRGQQHDEPMQRQRSIAALKRHAAALGYQINPLEAVA